VSLICTVIQAKKRHAAAFLAISQMSLWCKRNNWFRELEHEAKINPVILIHPSLKASIQTNK
jgi:hypothetical protein